MPRFLSRARLLMRCLAHDRRGATSIEYAIVGTGIAVAVAALVFGLGTKTQALYQSLVSLL